MNKKISTENFSLYKKTFSGITNVILIAGSILMGLMVLNKISWIRFLPFPFSENFMFKTALLTVTILVMIKSVLQYIQNKKKNNRINSKHNDKDRFFSFVSWFYCLMVIFSLLCGTNGPSSVNQLIISIGLPMFVLYFPLLLIEIICACFKVCRWQSVLLLLIPLFIIKPLG